MSATSPEKVIFVHASCHNTIHKTDKFPNPRPSDEESAKFYKKSNVTCSD